MFAHIFTNRLKCLLRSRVTVFWTLMFPILLAIFFNLSVRNIDSKEEIFHPVPVAVVNDSAYQKDASFRTALKSVSNGKNRIFTLTETSKANAAKLLADGKVDGYLTAGTKIGMTVNNSDFNQSIIESFLDSYMQTSSAVTSIMTANPSSYQKLAENMKTQADYLKNAPIGNASPNNALAYFYSLIAMACLYGSFWGMQEVTDIQADLSQRAARINLAPVHKLKAFLSSMTAAFVLSFLEILILLAFLRYGLNIDFGPKFGFVILTALVGCVVGLSLGAFVSALVKIQRRPENRDLAGNHHGRLRSRRHDVPEYKIHHPKRRTHCRLPEPGKPSDRRVLLSVLLQHLQPVLVECRAARCIRRRFLRRYLLHHQEAEICKSLSYA